VPRQARTLGDHCIYHVMNRGQDGLDIFRGLHDYLAFLDMLMVARQRYKVELFAFCLLPDHFHLLVRPTKGDELSYCMQWLQTSYARRYNEYYACEGPLWQGRYKSCLVQENGCLLAMMRFIEAHPVRSGLAERALDYVWSSHRENYWGNRRQKLDQLPVPLPGGWFERVDVELSETILRQMVLCSHRQLPFGLAEWQKHKCRELGLEGSFRPRGRPGKQPAAAKLSGALLIALLLMPLSLRAADLLDGYRFTRISGADQAAVLTTPAGRLQLVRVGDAVGPTARITDIGPGRVILEKPGPAGMARLMVRIEKGSQKITRITPANDERRSRRVMPGKEGG